MIKYAVEMNVSFSFLKRGYQRGFPGGISGKEPARQCRSLKGHRFDPRVGKVPWRRAQKPTPVFLPDPMDRGARRASVQRVTESDTTEAT